MDHEFNILFKKLCEARCIKRPVAAGTYVNGTFYFAINECKETIITETDHEEDGLPEANNTLVNRAICGRELFVDEDSPEALAVCQSLHAEDSLARILSKCGYKSDGIAWVVGHYYSCRNCAQALRKIGVTELRVKEAL
jgi:hypothetical protein